MRIAPFLLCLVLLSGCGSEAPATKERIADPEARGDVLPVMGLERRVTVLATGMIDGAGLKEEETYAARLESALRARGVNARVRAMRSLKDARGQPGELVVALDKSLAGAGLRVVVPAMQVPDALLGSDGVHPDARGVEELVAQSVDQVAAALPVKR